jgi:hypothetical protein
MNLQNRNDLQELVDSPSETHTTEYKAWLDLSQNEHRADLARHIAAIARFWSRLSWRQSAALKPKLNRPGFGGGCWG